MFKYHLEHILPYTAKLGEREVIGPVPEGLRVNVHVTGGEVTGPKISAKFRSLSGDWVTKSPTSRHARECLAALLARST